MEELEGNEELLTNVQKEEEYKNVTKIIDERCNRDIRKGSLIATGITIVAAVISTLLMMWLNAYKCTYHTTWCMGQLFFLVSLNMWLTMYIAKHLNK